MTVQDLIAELEQYDDDVEVRLILNQRHSLEYYADGPTQYEGVVYLTAQEQIGYISSDALPA